MKITICTFGSRGDTQPYVALALGLQQAGHHVTLVASRDHIEWVRSYGVNVHPIGFSMQEFVRKPEHRAGLRGRNVVRILREFRSGMETYLAKVMDNCWEAAQEAEFVALSSVASIGVDLANQRGIPMALVSLQPLFPPTRAFPVFMLPFRFSLGGGYNYLTYTLYMRAGWLLVGGMFNHWRTTRLGLPSWRSMREMLNTLGDHGTPWLYGYSPQVLPKPPDWADNHHVTGYLFLDAQPDWQPPAELERFLESGPPPVYVGFGSMSDKDPERVTRLVLRALELTGQRGILLTGWGAVARLPTSASVFYVDDAPHSWLFPRTAAVVHHGGAGTTAAGLRAGAPSLITPFLLDQYAWADRVEKLGVGLRLADSKRLTAEKLAQAIHTAVTDSALRARAAAFGERIQAEDGVACAVEVIERHAADFSRSRDKF
ncbi:MAG: glycosyltransferase family 1 protein [Anaerolineae bacterium]|nr:glycosyltransferase family 1 protein [Anaerolineae bacterium]